MTIVWNFLDDIQRIEIDTTEHDAKIRADVEKELQGIELLGALYSEIRADAKADAENRMQRILDDEKRLSYQQGRADAIDEVLKTIARFCEFDEEQKREFRKDILEQLKEQNNE